MRNQILNIVVLIFFSISIFANQPDDILKQAEQAYKQKNYTQAIELYNSLIHQNYYSAELYYNLGNAYYKNNQLGKAILFYEKAKKLNPSDNDINHNLKIAYSKTIDKIETKDNFFIEITKNNFLNQLNANALAYTSIVLSFLALITFALFLYFKPFKKLNLILTLVFSILAFVVYIIGYAAKSSHQEQDFGIITQKEIKVSNEPLPNSVAKFKLHEGTKVKVLQKTDNFYLIRLENGIEGWVNDTSVELI